MAELFRTTPQNVTIHIKDIYTEEDLYENATCKQSLQVRTEGKRTVHRMQKMYNLDVTISVGYRVGCWQETLRLHPHARDISCKADQ